MTFDTYVWNSISIALINLQVSHIYAFYVRVLYVSNYNIYCFTFARLSGKKID